MGTERGGFRARNSMRQHAIKSRERRWAVVVCTVLPLLVAQSAFGQKTGFQFNGRAWESFSEAMKLGYVLGFTEAVSTGVCEQERLPCHMQMGEMTKAVDRVYEEPENVLLPIPMAIHIVTMKAAGMDPAAFEKEVAALRRLAKALEGASKALEEPSKRN